MEKTWGKCREQYGKKPEEKTLEPLPSTTLAHFVHRPRRLVLTPILGKSNTGWWFGCHFLFSHMTWEFHNPN